MYAAYVLVYSGCVVCISINIYVMTTKIFHAMQEGYIVYGNVNRIGRDNIIITYNHGR